MKLLHWLGSRDSGWTVARLVRESGTTRPTIERILAGGRVRDLEVARKISRATNYQVSVRELMQLTWQDLGLRNSKRKDAA